jgi:predicted site-specific integrase-resolvase
VIEPDKRKDAIVWDLREVMVSLCVRLYGKGSAKSRPVQAATGE